MIAAAAIDADVDTDADADIAAIALSCSEPLSSVGFPAAARVVFSSFSRPRLPSSSAMATRLVNLQGKCSRLLEVR